ncbi:MAG: leucine-rich repeat domain-containing protein [Ruminococcaceae bacterium]|nr:leucine-rich repeat domain-containing protein [Oscillospiraceae bacterium]
MKIFLKKTLCIILAAAVVAAIPVFGADLTELFTLNAEAAKTPEYLVSGDYVYTIENNRAVIAKYIGSDVNVVVPEEIEGLTVYEIDTEAFTDSADSSTVNIRWKNENLKNIESVVLPDSIRYIGVSAFENCSKLTSIKLPENLYTIYGRAFYGTALSEIDLPQKNLRYIYNQTFDKTNIKELVIPECVNNLGQGSLYCETLDKVTIEGYTFRTFSSVFSKRIIVDGKARYIARYPEEIFFLHSQSSSVIEVFDDMRKNEETGYWEPVIFKEGYAYYDYTDNDIVSNGTFDYIVTPDQEVILMSYNLKSNGTININTIYENGKYLPVVEIAPYAFYGCNLTKIYISSYVKRIGYGAFMDSENLRAVTLPEGIKVIESETFSGCNLLCLTDTGMPETITEIGYGAFYQCGVCYTYGAENVEKLGAYAFYNNSIFDYNFYKVKEIAPYAFYTTTFGKIDFPEGVERICEYAFCNSYLDTVTLPETLKIIDDYAFERCSLDEVQLPKSLEHLGSHAFSKCALTEVDIPPLLTKIGYGAFSGCPLKKVYVPSNIEVIEADAFACKNYTIKEIVIAEGVEEIGSCAFSGAMVDELIIPSTIKKINIEALTEVYINTLYYNAIEAEIINYSDITGSLFATVGGTLPTLIFGEGVKTIPDYFAFKSKVEAVELPDSVEYIGSYAFGNCFYLTTVNMPNNLKVIGERAFHQTDISELILPYGLQTIGERAFAGCVYLADVDFPSTVNTIGDYAFADCKLIEEITLPENVDLVGQFAFFNCEGLKEVTIPENVNSIGELAFYQCENIITVNLHAASCDIIPATEFDEEIIPESPFISSQKLENINLYNTVKELPAFLYAGLQNIDKISLPASVTDIGVGAFANSSISGFDSLSNVESIEEYAFKNCTYLEEIKLEDNLLLIGMGAFMGCDWLKTIYIPDTVSNIETSVFEGCTKLESVRMSPNVNYIPRQAFHNCTALSEFIWESESKLIGRYAFGNCVKLSDFDFVNVEKLYKNSFTGSGVSVVQLGESQNEQNTALETIDVQSFKECEKLETLGIGGNVSTVKSQAFADCTNLETAVIADSVTEIADDAFDGCDKLTIYCAENSYAHSYAQTQGIRVSTFVVDPIPNQTYTGFEIEPDVSVSVSGDTLDKNVDFGVTYANNINVGNADVTVKGKGDFRMFASRANFAIVTKKISETSVLPVLDQSYTGSAVTPSLTITDGGNVLREGVDYSVTYSNNINSGTATAKITGIGNYSGSMSTSFKIVKMSESQSFLNRIISFFNTIIARIRAFIVGIFM